MPEKSHLNKLWNCILRLTDYSKLSMRRTTNKDYLCGLSPMFHNPSKKEEKDLAIAGEQM